MLIDPRVQALGHNSLANHGDRFHTQRLAKRRVARTIMCGAQNQIRARGRACGKATTHIGKHGATPLEKRFTRGLITATRDHKRVGDRNR